MFSKCWCPRILFKLSGKQEAGNSVPFVWPSSHVSTKTGGEIPTLLSRDGHQKHFEIMAPSKGRGEGSAEGNGLQRGEPASCIWSGAAGNPLLPLDLGGRWQ